MEWPVIWVGSSLEDLKAFPENVKDQIGYVLGEVQNCRHHADIKSLKGFSGVFEIIADFQTDTYRTVYATKIENAVYVLHAFKKKSKKGIATPKPDLDLVKQRLKMAQTIVKQRRQ
jgi:phage-related protein